MAALSDELGDLLIQVALHAQIANENGDFDAADVFDAISSKLIRRHPHVFGDVVANDPAAVIANLGRGQADPSRARKIWPSARRSTSCPASMPVSLKIADLESVGRLDG